MLIFPWPPDLNKLDAIWDTDVVRTRKRPNQWIGRMAETKRTLHRKITTITDFDTRIVSDGLKD